MISYSREGKRLYLFLLILLNTVRASSTIPEIAKASSKMLYAFRVGLKKKQKTKGSTANTQYRTNRICVVDVLQNNSNKQQRNISFKIQAYHHPHFNAPYSQSVAFCSTTKCQAIQHAHIVHPRENSIIANRHLRRCTIK